MMTPPKDLLPNTIVGGLVLALALVTAVPSARANVYATNIKINGGITNVSVLAGTNVTISYILNEPASAGVTIKILSGATAVRTISLAGGSAGTTRGTNSVVWDGKSDYGANVPGGKYSVSLQAAATGYAGWTKITDDNNPGNYSYYTFGIAVDRNTNSPYYGRIFVGNSQDNSADGTSPYLGDYVGLQKLNADGSYADEGGFSDGGVAWPGAGLAPYRIRISDDDFVYVQDFDNAGDLYRFDPILSTNSALHVFAPAISSSQGSWSGFCIAGGGTNTVLWGADANYLSSMGICRFSVRPDGTFNPAAPTQVVAVGGSPGMDLYPWAVAVDKAGALYTVQQCNDQGNPSAWVLGFPAYNPATNGGAPEFTADWFAGPADDYCGARGLAVDPTGTYVAACFWGYIPPGGDYTSGNTKILKAADGTLVTNLDLGIAYTNSLTTDPTHHEDSEADWDAVGNVYYYDDWPGCWRAFSPPGANQATTVALATVQVIGSVQPPVITSIGVSAGMVTIHFTGGSGDVASAFLLLSAPVVSGPYSPAAGAILTGSGGSFQATVPINGPRQFYRIERLGTIPIQIANLRVAGGTVTNNFTSAASDAASAFTLLSSAAINGTYSTAVGASISQVSPGVFQAVVAPNGPRQFYRIRK